MKSANFLPAWLCMPLVIEAGFGILFLKKNFLPAGHSWRFLIFLLNMRAAHVLGFTANSFNAIKILANSLNAIDPIYHRHKKKSLQCHSVAFKGFAKISMAFRKLTLVIIYVTICSWCEGTSGIVIRQGEVNFIVTLYHILTFSPTFPFWTGSELLSFDFSKLAHATKKLLFEKQDQRGWLWWCLSGNISFNMNAIVAANNILSNWTC